ncbi:AI-2E family transporter [Caldalkalibacillus mannanilyticus]|uniref:AI-2E family transporter n=1 Tax=Caldalkalibacillus mannanilyticus TaxID=1418 RepID=UPI00046AE75A|nr:AI-2E family transporter [Caldalkalibacillus mannanilyticus]
MPKGKFFTFSYGTILVLLIIFLLEKVKFVFTPFVIAFQTLFFPFLIAGVLYYLFRPLVDFLCSKKIPRVIAILLLYLSLIAVMGGLILKIGPVLQQQVQNLIDNAPKIADTLRYQWQNYQLNQASFPSYINEAIVFITSKAEQMLYYIGYNVTTILGAITSFIVIMVIVPLILFYLLKDGKKAPDQLLNFLPNGEKREGKQILSDMNKALSTYVQGQVIVSLCVGIMVYIGYLVIDLEYSLILALVAMFTNVIPFVGPFIGLLPALIVGFIDSPGMMIKVMLIVLVAQQIESNFISPQIMGRALDVHPLTIILLLLVASSLGGILGLILAVPIYAMLKVVVKHAYRLIELRKA